MNLKVFGRERGFGLIETQSWNLPADSEENYRVSEPRFETSTSQIHEVYCYINLLVTFQTVTLLAAILCKGGSTQRILSAGSVNIISAQLQNFIYK
jgi:hypothetical protein